MTETVKRVVYAVATGEYSNYGVRAIYEREEDAQACADRIGGYVEEYPLYPPGDDSYRIRTRYWAELRVMLDGTHQDLREWTLPESCDQELELSDEALGPPRFGYYQVMASAPSPTQAVKAVRERAAKLSALIIEGHDPLAIDPSSA